MRYRVWAAAVCLPLAVCVVAGGQGGDESKGRQVSLKAATQPAGPRSLSALTAQTPHVDEEHLAAAQGLINNGVRFLLDQRDSDGGWSLGRGANKPAVTAMVLKALLQHPDFDARSPEVMRGLEVMLRCRQKDGGIYEPREGLANYTTAVAIMAMTAAQDPKLNDEIRQAAAFLKGQQIVPGAESPDGQKITEDHPYAGGFSYGEHGRPDLSNVGMTLQALHDAGIPSDDPAIQRALRFVLRTQNRSESNPMGWAKAGDNDGGFVYAPSVGGGGGEGESKAGSGAGGKGLRSYGSMTYVGFKSMLYAGLSKGDPRVQAAYGWIRRYWRLDSNPNMPQARSSEGLYYYYHAFAKALRAWGEPVIVDAKGARHNWRQELIAALRQRVRPDGSWTNDADRWYESYPALVTCYSVLALQEALKK